MTPLSQVELLTTDEFRQDPSEILWKDFLMNLLVLFLLLMGSDTVLSTTLDAASRGQTDGTPVIWRIKNNLSGLLIMDAKQSSGGKGLEQAVEELQDKLQSGPDAPHRLLLIHGEELSVVQLHEVLESLDKLDGIKVSLQLEREAMQ